MKITAIIKPNSKHRHEVVLTPDGSYQIYTTAPAIEGRANTAAIELLADYFGVSKSQVKLLRGQRSRIKVFEIMTKI